MQIEFHTKGNPLRLALTKCQQILWLVRESLDNLESHSHARHVAKISALEDHNELAMDLQSMFIRGNDTLCMMINFRS